MNRLVIPTIAVLAVIALGTIILSPVDQVSAVHTTILANIEDQQRTLYFTADNGSSVADTNIVIATLGAAQDFGANGFVSSVNGACGIDDQGDATLIVGVANTIVEGSIDVLEGNYALGDDIEIDIDGDTTCYVYLQIETWENP